MDDKMTVFGDWALPNPSPRTLLSSFLNEGFESKSFSDILAENGSNGSLPKFKNPEMPVNPKEEAVGDEFDFSNDISLEPKLFDFRKSSSSGCLAQRIARTGFNAPTINTARIKLGNTPFSQSEIRSPYLTIPPGLSPTVLLDSPVFLSNSMAQPSPTTGKISFKINETNSFSISASDSAVPDESKDDHLEDNAPAGFSFESPLNMSLLASSSSSSSSFPCQEDRGPSAIDRPQSLQDMEASFQKDFDFPASFSEPSDRKDGAVDSTICRRPTDSFISNENSTPLDDLPNKEGTQGELSSITVATPAEDGYSWRKSGQKQVNASEYPRSYYKCTHPNCQAKKMIERSHDGHITETIHKGAHNHTKPLPHRRPGMPFSHPFNDARVEGLEHNGSHVNFDATVTSFGDPFAAIQTEDLSLFASPEAIDVSSSVSNDEEEEDRAAHGSISLGGEGEGVGEESESKRRKLDACAVEMSSVSRPLREPRVVIQTISEVDILDDGYRWRKYGQKVVKGNPNPRSYYKCTYLGCTVRKHVERASHDLESVITTYEGKHNHEVPAARNSSHSNPAPSVTPPTDQHMTLNKRPNPTQATLMPGTLGLPGREQQLGFRPGFSFGTGQQGLANVGIGTGLGPSFLR